MSKETEPGFGWGVIIFCFYIMLLVIEAKLVQIAHDVDRIAAAQARK